MDLTNDEIESILLSNEEIQQLGDERRTKYLKELAKLRDAQNTSKTLSDSMDIQIKLLKGVVGKTEIELKKGKPKLVRFLMVGVVVLLVAQFFFNTYANFYECKF